MSKNISIYKYTYSFLEPRKYHGLEFTAFILAISYESAEEFLNKDIAARVARKEGRPTQIMLEIRWREALGLLSGVTPEAKELLCGK